MDKNNTIVTEVANNSTANSTSEIFVYDFQVNLENGDDLEFKVPSNVIMMESPLRGYRCASGSRPMLGSTNKLVYSPLDKAVMPRVILLCVASLIVGLIIGAGVMYAVGQSTNIFDKSPIVTQPGQTEENQTQNQSGTDVKGTETKEVKTEAKPTETKATETKAAEAKPAEVKSETKPETKPVEQPAPVDVAVIAAIKYLQENTVWNRINMEEHAPLKGLWDALNTRAFKKIADKKYDCLLGSEKFKQLRSVAKQVQPRTWNANYTSPGDDDITIDPYIKKLEALIPAANQ